MNTNTPSNRCATILDEMARIPVLIPGTLSPRQDAHGKVTGWKLQHWHGGRNETRYIPAGLVEIVRQGTAGHEQFQALAEEFADLRGRQALGEEPGDAKKKPMRP